MMGPVERGVRIVGGLRYVNMTQAAHYLGRSVYGWQKYRERLVAAGKLKIYKFEDDAKASYILASDLEKLKNPIPKEVKKKEVNEQL